ncbi:unnamed protein product [Nippostrongylus brasiliensis]|uniref:Tetratricopeptide repeat protein, tpr, putative (inferred by orthology to a S. mansoni protein) n=1 Tax=Nippostrongylus brasiliensis TaxID=27835 RepID=A0A0N4YYF9_NIPBR|nr:unnamed protein product [Nippostrongylus brasiliensis]
MTTKLRGSRLEAEVDRSRADGNWRRLSELLHAMKSKHSGMEDMVELVEAELVLETFLEQQGEVLRPRRDHANGLRDAEILLNETVDRRSEGTVLEAHLLLAKLHYACARYTEALKDIENSGMESANTPFRTLRALRLVAEVYAIKGDILECCLERVAALRVRDSAIERKSNVEGIEWYRRIITCLGDKSTGERLQQKMSRQFAELLIRAVPADGKGGAASQAVSMKSQNLRCSVVIYSILLGAIWKERWKFRFSFYMGSHKGYFSPASKTEEVVLLLLISEVRCAVHCAKNCAFTVAEFNVLIVIM